MFTTKKVLIGLMIMGGVAGGGLTVHHIELLKDENKELVEQIANCEKQLADTNNVTEKTIEPDNNETKESVNNTDEIKDNNIMSEYESILEVNEKALRLLFGSHEILSREHLEDRKKEFSEFATEKAVKELDLNYASVELINGFIERRLIKNAPFVRIVDEENARVVNFPTLSVRYESAAVFTTQSANYIYFKKVNGTWVVDNFRGGIEPQTTEEIKRMLFQAPNYKDFKSFE